MRVTRHKRMKLFPRMRECRTEISRSRLRGLNPAKWLFIAVLLIVSANQAFGESGGKISTAELKKMTLKQLMSMKVTSVAKHPQKWSHSPSAIQVVTSSEIDRSGATSIPQALQLADNLDVAQRGASNWAISARGFNIDLANKLLVLMDGRSVYTPLYSGVYWDVQSYIMHDIDRIEVISGPGGTLWGENAVNGVINIITKTAKRTQGLYLEAGGGNELRDLFGARYGGKIGASTYYRVYGKYFDHAAEVLSNGGSANDQWNNGQGGFRIDSRPSVTDRITLQGNYYGGNEGVVTGGTEKVSGGDILAHWSHRSSATSNIKILTYFDRTHRLIPVPPLKVQNLTLAPAGIFQDDLDTYDLQMQDSFALADVNRIIWGLGYRYTHEVEHNAPALAFYPPVLDQNLFSIFAQDQIAVTRQFTFIAGTKLQHNAYTGFELEPNVRLRFELNARQMIWAAVSRAVRTPSRIERGLSEGEPQYFVLLKGDSGFVSETVNAYELGYRAEIADRFVTSISTFYNYYNNLRSTSPTPKTIFPFYFQNNLEGDTYGVEVVADYQAFDWWRLHLGYDFLKEHIYVKPGRTDINNALNETADHENQFFLRLNMNLPHNVTFYSALRWIDVIHNNQGPVVGTVPAYWELNARLAWHLNRSVEMSVVGRNLLQARHVEYGFPGPTREEILRSIYGEISYSL